SKFLCRMFDDGFTKRLGETRPFEPGQGEMRGERAIFPWIAKRRKRGVGVERESNEFRRSLHTNPEDARPFFVGKETKSAELNFDRRGGMHLRENGPNPSEFSGVRLADEFQGQMQILDADPFELRRQRAQVLYQGAQALAHIWRNLQRDEKTHFVTLAWLPIGCRTG